ncbi:unnamed protein product [Pelagomonas calceolata]|uniref:Uncharacterized protein n=1 Tax=Pelagomonas calceolata TaxID=35677 RepID=A0A8J2SBN4_9STRA|nr:unnamed protein product [Pelagomonas calceolata]|mmetsp:Transcript_1929/g.5699  ORF Transcript_1929/g.5699 Transcript_1929/m.5699 type:complete len:614 (+) Transcript_1929:144-1985(+)
MTENTTNPCYIATLADDLQRHVMVFLEGPDCCGAGGAIKRWRALQDERWWHLKTKLDFCVGRWDANDEPSWRAAYARCKVGPSAARWAAGPTRAHGLGDRVAAPQMFISPDGRHIYNYGGWTGRGPQTDLEVSSADAYEAFARGAEAEPRFRLCPSSGAPAHPGGAQSLTPLWLPGGGAAPSQALVASLAPAGFLRAGDRAHLILAFGGGLGGYRHEHESLAVGVLADLGGDEAPRVHWVRPEASGSTPTRRCAHTATYVPARCFAEALNFPEGAVVFYGGHTENGRELAAPQVLCVKSWKWFDLPTHGRGLPTHGHSAALVERGGGAYIVFVGGGTGSILDDPARCQEHSVAQVLDLHTLGDVYRDPFLPTVQLAHESCAPGRHHTACRVSKDCVLLYGGGDNPDPAVCVLDLAAVVDAAVTAEMTQAAASAQAAETERRGLARRALSRLAAGLTRSVSSPATVALQDLGGGETTPTPRKFHASCSLYPWRPLLVIFGGWQVDRHFDDMWVLAHGDLASYGTPDGYGSDDDDEVEIVLQVGGRRERVLIERSTLEALLENGRFTELPNGTFAMQPPPAVMMPPGGDPETGSSSGDDDDDEEDSSSEDGAREA